MGEWFQRVGVGVRQSTGFGVLAKPGSITPHIKFNAEVLVLTKEEGGRHTPFFTGYRPQFYIRTTDVTGVVKLPEGAEMIMPGDNVTVEVELITAVAIENGVCLPPSSLVRNKTSALNLMCGVMLPGLAKT